MGILTKKEQREEEKEGRKSKRKLLFTHVNKKVKIRPIFNTCGVFSGLQDERALSSLKF